MDRRLRVASCSVRVHAVSIPFLVVNARRAAADSPHCIVLKAHLLLYLKTRMRHKTPRCANRAQSQEQTQQPSPPTFLRLFMLCSIMVEGSLSTRPLVPLWNRASATTSATYV